MGVQLSFIAPRFLALPWVPRVRSDGGVIGGAETLIPTSRSDTDHPPKKKAPWPST